MNEISFEQFKVFVRFQLDKKNYRYCRDTDSIIILDEYQVSLEKAYNELLDFIMTDDEDYLYFAELD